jgi:hypothetical protein
MKTVSLLFMEVNPRRDRGARSRQGCGIISRARGMSKARRSPADDVDVEDAQPLGVADLLERNRFEDAEVLRTPIGQGHLAPTRSIDTTRSP